MIRRSPGRAAREAALPDDARASVSPNAASTTSTLRIANDTSADRRVSIRVGRSTRWPARRLDHLVGTDSVDEPVAERACRRQAGKGRSPIDVNTRHGSKTIGRAVVRAGQARVMCYERHE